MEEDDEDAVDVDEPLHDFKVKLRTKGSVSSTRSSYCVEPRKTKLLLDDDDDVDGSTSSSSASSSSSSN